MFYVFTLGHAFIVHFAAALFIISVVAFLIPSFAEAYIIKFQSRLIARWGLWISTITLLISLILGYFASTSAAHDGLSHVLLIEHWMLAGLVTFFALILSYWSWALFKKDREEGAVFLVVHVFAGLIMLYVTWIGSQLVYEYGVGVKILPDIEKHKHETPTSLNDDFKSITDKYFSR